jgi:hypothetical protein
MNLALFDFDGTITDNGTFPRSLLPCAGGELCSERFPSARLSCAIDLASFPLVKPDQSHREWASKASPRSPCVKLVADTQRKCFRVGCEGARLSVSIGTRHKVTRS